MPDKCFAPFLVRRISCVLLLQRYIDFPNNKKNIHISYIKKLSCCSDKHKELLVHSAPKCSPPKLVQDDLRPITVTAQLAKVMEGFALFSLIDQASMDKLDCKQFSIRKNLPHKPQCIFYILFLNHWIEVITMPEFFFADFSKGFDWVDHNALIRELNLLEVNSFLASWMGAFLTVQASKG